jgi:adenine deaminase
MSAFSISGNIVDVFQRRIFPGTVRIDRGKIVAIDREETAYSHYILPGFVDAHVHIESSMLPPAEFARLATVHGTVATVSDPHEIANVLGLAGVRFMLANAAQTPLEIAFGAPACVPATTLETAGATISAADIQELFDRDGITYGLKVGLLRVGDTADAIVVNHLQDFQVRQTYVKGVLVAKEGQPLIHHQPAITLNHFVAQPKTSTDFRLPAEGKICASYRAS